jgi:hypothetical protein
MNDDNVGNALAKNNHELLCDYDICALFFIVFNEKKNPYNFFWHGVKFLKLVFIDIVSLWIWVPNDDSFKYWTILVYMKSKMKLIVYNFEL